MQFIEHIVSAVAEFIVSVISTGGYWGVAGLMAIDSMNIPMPSEIVLPFSGYLVSTGRFDFWIAVLAGTVGSTLGSVLSYWIGWAGGRPFAMRYGRYFLVSPRDLDRADRLFKRYGSAIAFFSRMIPVVRTFISLPAGVSRMPFWRFTLFSFLGALPWCIGFVFLGQKVGENYRSISERFHGIEYVIVGGLALGFVVWVIHFIREQREAARLTREYRATHPQKKPGSDR